MRDRMLDALQRQWDGSGAQGVTQPLDIPPLDLGPDAA
jgi:hypothetical protein